MNLFTPFHIPGAKAKTEVVDNKDGTFTVTYVPLTSGMYTLLLKYGGQTVPGFPAKVTADPAVDTSKVKVFGPGVEGQGTVRPPKGINPAGKEICMKGVQFEKLWRQKVFVCR